MKLKKSSIWIFLYQMYETCPNRYPKTICELVPKVLASVIGIITTFPIIIIEKLFSVKEYFKADLIIVGFGSRYMGMALLGIFYGGGAGIYTNIFYPGLPLQSESLTYGWLLGGLLILLGIVTIIGVGYLIYIIDKKLQARSEKQDVIPKYFEDKKETKCTRVEIID